MRDFIDKHSPDLFLIQETHLRPEYSFNIPNYICYRNDRTGSTRGWGGTAILIKRSIPHFHVPTLPLLVLKQLSLRSPPQIRNLSWLPLSMPHQIQITETWEPTSTNFQFCYPPPQLNTTWSIFTKILANSDNFFLPTANSTHEIDSQVSNLTDEILNAHASASRPFYHTEQPYLQGELKELFKERNKARKTWQHTRHPQHKTELNRLQNAIKRKIYHYRQQAWEDNLSTLNAEDNSLWGIAKAFRKKTSPISALNGPTGIALSDTNKTEVIAHSLEKQFHLNDIHNPRKDEIITSVVDAYMDSNTNNTDIIPPLSHLKLFRSLKRLKSKSVRGEMGSLTKCLKITAPHYFQDY
ncbi:uncharacterized protein TNCV_1208961 [Trichonephila clavipes]|nr:uncharacterized protein TNCV_1208961 [Trichonephila clavipes]